MSEPSDYTRIFFPNFLSASQRVAMNGARFAYYTTAQTAYLLLRNSEIWMRHTGVMNDYLEVEHGLECIRKARSSSAGNAFTKAMELCYPGSSAEFESRFANLEPVIREQTYVTSVSEHMESEDAYGRLSMWRAYGGSAGVAIILNGGVMLRPSDALGAHATPVLYTDDSGISEELLVIANNIAANPERARSWGREGFLSALTEVFRFAAICTKHPSFKEEKEWRVVSTRKIQRSTRLTENIETLGGIPQRILKFKLEDAPELGLTGLHPSQFIERVLIGPCEYPETIRDALIDALRDVGVDSAESKVHVTGVPLRANQR